MELQEQTPAPAEQEPIAPDAAGDTPSPQKSQESQERGTSIEDALSKAFKADLSQKGESKEVVKAEAESPPDATPEGEEGQPRGPDGKFVAKDGGEKPDTAPEKPEGGGKPDKRTDTASGHSEAPARFSADAKAAWKDAPEPVRAEAHRMMRELEDGLAQKDSQLEPLKPYFDMAKKSGVRIEDAMQRYVGMETMLRQNPAQGFRQLAQNMGLAPQQVAEMLTGKQAEGQPDPRDRQIAQMGQQIHQLRQQLGGVSQSVQSQHEAQIGRQVEEFAASHPRFEELAPDITHMLETGYATSLDDAYEKAERLNPAPQLAQPAPPPVSAQTRETKSVTGAPSAGSNPAKRAPSKSPEEALKRAFNM